MTSGTVKGIRLAEHAATPKSGMDRMIQKKTWTLKRITWLAAGLALVAVFLWSALPFRGGRTLRVPAERLTIMMVTRGVFHEFIPITGTVIPKTKHYLDVIEGGRVEEIFREAGSLVEKGDEILKLVNPNLLLDIMYREAELFQQSNNLRNTKILMENNRLQMRRELLETDHEIARQRRITDSLTKLMKDDLVSRQKYEEARDRLAYLTEEREMVLVAKKQDERFRQDQVQQLEQSLERMQANLEILKQNMDNLVIHSPVTGQLTALNAEIGQSKERGARLGQIDVLDGFKLRATIDEYYITRVSLESKGTFTFSEDIYQVSIDRIYPQVVRGRFEVDLKFTENEPAGIRHGQTIRLRLELGEPSEALLLPYGSFYQTTGGRWAYVLDKDSRTARKREIDLGRQNPQFCEVLGGLVPGDRVITSSYEIFGDADRLVLRD